METTEEANGNCRPPSPVGVPPPRPELTVFEAKESSFFHSIFAVALWLGAIHLNFLILFITFAFLSLPKALALWGFMLILVVIPVDEENKWGEVITRYICRHVCGYFPITLHVEDIKAFDPNQSYVFGYEPHSILPIGCAVLADLVGFMPLPKIKVLASNAVFYTPFMRHIWTWMRTAPASRKSFISLLLSGYSCAIVPGGVQEACLMERGSEVLFIKKRRGFIRIAIETGRPLVPVFCFGQSSAFKWWKPGGKLYVQICRAVKFTPILFWGRCGSPIPFRHPLHVVVGRPIEVKRNPQPTMEEVAEVHSQFVEALQDLYERHKTRLGYSDLKLRVL